MAAAAALVLLAGCGASLNEGEVPSAQLSGEKSAAGAASVPAAAGAPVTAGAAPSSQTAQDLAKAAQQVSSAASSTSAYKIGAQDVLEVSVFKVPDLSKTVQVADSGSVNLPLVGEIPAAGRTAQEVERDLTKRLGDKYLQSPQVTVFVKEYNSQRVTIEGAVKKPGVYPIRGKSSLLQLIATAEGLTEVAESEVVVFRETDGKRAAAKFNIDSIRKGDQPDPQMLQGDTIVVSTSGVAQAYQQLLKVLHLGSCVSRL